MNNTKLLSQADVAKILGSTVPSLNNLRHQGRLDIPYIKFGNRIRYREEDIEQWIESNIVNHKTTGDKNVK